MELTRINKFISETGFCSRREADRLVEQGKVTLNGKVAVLGDKASTEDDVRVNGKPLKSKRPAVYIAFNKPVGITCTTERNIKGNIIDYIRHKERIFPIGRLDKPSEGLIFLTSDGDIVNKILRAGNNHEKEYVVMVNKPVTEEFIRKMSSGVPILGTVTRKCAVRKDGTHVFTIVLTQGLNRQIRRMCEFLGYQVTKLRRVRIMNVTLENLPIGKWRDLTETEMAEINAAIADSVKTEEGSAIETWEE
ncbi:23S rRNA pseudouridine(2604) synthase RluF [Dyadobacter sp. CY343]|uniref:23S rRNA pseudouridine(2604) synthase RluF n=1 Tax=Dyadobacter sp. CY343 TaxID=2907299 RepID=UPI001F38C777|nr:23S rRNA pseudouridine(2604) synthase RluF [Dyadobacter sp. CY343]MCE7060567.1 23S rRNA pseudouridine(2604) synthase RluF [Dyadobacter sp. CY343]